jgi:hypothetical protein
MTGLSQRGYSNGHSRVPQKVMFFGAIWPEPSASAAGVRTMSLLQVTRDMGCEVHFCAPARLHMAPISAFEALGVKAHGLAAINSNDVDECVKRIQPDLVIFDRFITEEMFGWRVRSICPEAAHVVDTQDLHFLRHARQHIVEEQLVYSDPNLWNASIQASFSPQSMPLSATGSNFQGAQNLVFSTPTSPSKQNNPYKSSISMSSDTVVPSSLITDVDYYRQNLAKFGPMLDQETEPLKNLVTASKQVNVLQVAKRYPVVHSNMMRELAAIHRADLTLVVSHFEKDLLVRHLGVSPNKIEVSPFYYQNIPHTTWKQYKSKVGFSMIGHFKHPPNRDGIYWMKREIWPRIKRMIPSATIDVFGAHPDKVDMALTDTTSGFRVVGTLKADELTQRLQRARVNLAPLRYGAGIKGKIAENWFAGTPTVTTSIGAESMSAYLRQPDGTMAHSFGGEVADTTEEFARLAVSLYIDATRWHRARAAGYEILTHNFNMSINGPLTQDALLRVIEQRESLRDQNLVGSILWSAGYRYNEMFGRFVQMKTLASQKQLNQFVSDTKKASTSIQSNSPQNSSSSSASLSSSTSKDSSIAQNYPTEMEDTAISDARGLGHLPDEQASNGFKTESFTPKPTPTISSPSSSKTHHASQSSVNDDTDREFVFGVLEAEQERLAAAKLSKMHSAIPKPDFGEFDSSALAALKKTMK